MTPNGLNELTKASPHDSGMPLVGKKRLNPSASACRWPNFVLAILCLTVCFVSPLWHLVVLALSSQLYSYILLIPFISFYLFWTKRKELPPAARPSYGRTVGFVTAGAAGLLAGWLFLRPGRRVMEDDYLALMMGSYLLFFWGVCSHFLGAKAFRASAFPIGFLVFMVPIPAAVLSGIDSILQYGSAAVARGFFTMAGTPFLQDGLVFQLPGINIQIAPECSGIHSSLVLFITSLLAGYFFLKQPWNRVIILLAVIPLGIVRNGFRVFTIGELCVHISPQMIDSPIHHKGGPLFFALSLLPLFLLLILLVKSEKSGAIAQPPTAEIHPKNV